MPPGFGASATLSFLPLPSNGRSFHISCLCNVLSPRMLILCPHKNAFLSSKTKLKCPLLWAPFVITPRSFLAIAPSFFPFLYNSTFHVVSQLPTNVCVGFVRATLHVLLDLPQSSSKVEWPFLVSL